MRIGDFEIEPDTIGWRVYRSSECVKTGRTKGNPKHPHYFGRLDHLAAWMADDIARELAPACAAVGDLATALLCRLEVLSQPVEPGWRRESEGRRLSTKGS